MPRKARELSAIEVARLWRPGLHPVGGVAGLCMQVTPTKARTWILRATIAGKRRDMGLGGYPDVPLAAAREKARTARLQIDQGTDPILARREAKSELRAAAAAAKTFAECAAGFVDAKSAGWRNAKHRQQVANTLEQYAYPVIGNVLVRDVQLAHILQILEPLWTTKTETATRVRSRLENVLDWAKARGYRNGENPARWRGHLDKLLPARNKVVRVKHHRALDVDLVPTFMISLRAKPGVGARAVEFLVLTASRSGEVRDCRWSEIDLQKREWTIPAERMKAGKEHRVPLSEAAVKLIKSMPRIDGTELVFPSTKGTPLSDMTLTKVMRDMGVDAVPHGMRSTFKDWASERTSYPNEVSEMALAHSIGDKVEAAYRRGELFKKRRHLMADWSRFCTSNAPKQARKSRAA